MEDAARLAMEYRIAVRLEIDGAITFFPGGDLQCDDHSDEIGISLQKWREIRGKSKPS
jgi:hypothetical protein